MPPRIALWSLALAAINSLAADSTSIPGPAFAHFAARAALEASCTRNLRRAGAALKQLVRVSGGPGWLARDTVRANGGQLPPGTLVRRLLGRGSNAKAFFEKLER